MLLRVKFLIEFDVVSPIEKQMVSGFISFNAKKLSTALGLKNNTASYSSSILTGLRMVSYTMVSLMLMWAFFNISGNSSLLIFPHKK